LENFSAHKGWGQIGNAIISRLRQNNNAFCCTNWAMVER